VTGWRRRVVGLFHCSQVTTTGQASEFFTRNALGLPAMPLLAVYGNSGKRRYLSLMALCGAAASEFTLPMALRLARTAVETFFRSTGTGGAKFSTDGSTAVLPNWSFLDYATQFDYATQLDSATQFDGSGRTKWLECFSREDTA
jgi:hypothetical protein